VPAFGTEAPAHPRFGVRSSAANAGRWRVRAPAKGAGRARSSPARDSGMSPPRQRKRPATRHSSGCRTQVPLTPSLAKEVVSVAPARATPNVGLQELSEPMVAIKCLERVQGCVARRRACPRVPASPKCPRVPASPKMYPSRTREASISRHRR
jgi:hypothetical protein